MLRYNVSRPAKVDAQDAPVCCSGIIHHNIVAEFQQIPLPALLMKTFLIVVFSTHNNSIPFGLADLF